MAAANGKAQRAPDTSTYGGDLHAWLGDDEPLEDDDQDWLIRGVLPKAMPAMLAGYQKIGKTMMAIDMAIALACDDAAWCGMKIPEDNEGIRVLLMPREDHERLTKRRIWQFARGHGIDPRALAGRLEVDAVAPFYLDDASHQAKLARSCERFDVVFIDSWTTMHRLDENSTRDMQLVTTAWRDISLQTGTSLVPLHHFSGKGRTDDDRSPGHKLRGSSVLFSVARWVVGVAEADAEQPELGLEVSSTGNLAYRPAPFRIKLDSDHVDGHTSLRYNAIGSVQEIVVQQIDDAIASALRDADDGLSMRELRTAVRECVKRSGRQRGGARNDVIDERVRTLCKRDVIWADTKRRWQIRRDAHQQQGGT